MSTPPWGEQPAEQGPPPPPPSPYGQQQPPGSPYQPYGAPPAPYGSFQPTQQTNGLAIGSLIVSIASVVFCCGLPGIAGAIMGHIARKQIREQGQAGDGLALGGIIVGWAAFGLALAAVIFYVVVIVIFGVWAESVDCYYDSDGDYVCD
jgi:hypothetical protein